MTALFEPPITHVGAERTIAIEGRYGTEKMLELIRSFNRLEEESGSPICLEFRSALGAVTILALELSRIIKRSRCLTIGLGYEEVNSAFLLLISACRVKKMHDTCRCLVHAVQFPPNISAMVLDSRGRFPQELSRKVFLLNRRYATTLVRNCEGKLKLQDLRRIMAENDGRGRVIDAREALGIGIVDSLFTDGP